MAKFRLICPECGAVLIVQSPQAAVWELCPRCRHHVWDIYDALMADIYTADASEGPMARGCHARADS